MNHIKTFDEMNEGLGNKIVTLSIATLLALGISKADAQNIKNDQVKLSVIDTLARYNKTKDFINLKSDLGKNIDNPNKFIQEHLRILPDRTVVVKPSFIKGLELNVNPFDKSCNLTYSIKF